MDATLILADFARVADGKLDVIGGGWSMVKTQGPFGFAVGAVFRIPWDQTNAKHHFRFDLIDADGRGVPGELGETVRLEGDFEAGRPPGVKAGTTFTLPLAFRFGPLSLEPGSYEVRLTIDGETKDDWFVTFALSS